MSCPICEHERRPEEAKRAQARIKELEAEIEALKSAQAPKWPQINSECYTLECTGRIAPRHYFDTLAVILAQGNLFRTHAEAELEAKRRVVMQKLRILAVGTPANDWSGLYKIHGLWETGDYRSFIPGAIRFPSRAAAANALIALSTELEVLLPEAK